MMIYNLAIRKLLVVTFIVYISILLIGCAKSTINTGETQESPGNEFEAKTILKKPVNSDLIKPGLSVIYLPKLNLRHINDWPSYEKVLEIGTPGKPIPFLDHAFGNSDYVFDSGKRDKVYIQFSGFLYLPEKGNYHFKALSNDGIRVYLNGEMVVNDPDVHSDRMSKIRKLSIKKAGWYPIIVQYFENKKTSKIRLDWKPPKVENFSTIPAKNYGHIPKM